MDGQSLPIYGLVIVILGRTVLELVKERLNKKKDINGRMCPLDRSDTIRCIQTIKTDQAAQGERLSDMKSIMVSLTEVMANTRLTLVEVLTYLKTVNGHRK